MTNLALISSVNDLAAAAAAVACLITVFLRELVALPLPGGVRTNLDFGLDGHRVVLVLEDERDPSGALDFHHCHWSLLRLDPGRGCEYGFSSGLEDLNPPRRLITPSNPIVVCFSTTRLMSLFGLTGAM